MTAQIECLNPILLVKDIEASLSYYVKALGFEAADWVTESATFALVLRDGFGIYLAHEPEAHSKSYVWIGVEDVEVLYEEFKANGANIQKEPVNYSWAYEMRVEDPDGHVLRIGSEPREELPYND
jgi:predicted lactoylglutathione lyase